LLLAIVCGSLLLLAQIGDGDIVAVRPSGTALLPVPRDPRLDGRHTTSMCTKAAEGAFRGAVVDLTATELAGVLLATDGYANAQAARAWEDAVSADLAKLIREQQAGWLAGQLPGWAARCASTEGSADDTTIALLLAPPGKQAAPFKPAQGGAAGAKQGRAPEPGQGGAPEPGQGGAPEPGQGGAAGPGQGSATEPGQAGAVGAVRGGAVPVGAVPGEAARPAPGGAAGPGTVAEDRSAAGAP
jgi:protein phosphatase 2C-like protein